jgi:hypothetical protein
MNMTSYLCFENYIFNKTLSMVAPTFLLYNLFCRLTEKQEHLRYITVDTDKLLHKLI